MTVLRQACSAGLLVVVRWKKLCSFCTADNCTPSIAPFCLFSRKSFLPLDAA